jgi:hypothetical protein
MSHFIVWNKDKTEGFATVDQALAYEVRKSADTNCFTQGGEYSPVAVAFCDRWGDEDCTTEEVPTMQPYIVEGLRALRLHHWKGVLEFSKRIAHYEARLAKCIPGFLTVHQLRLNEALEHSRRVHSFQMKQVQLLNDFFPIGDTAERDNDNATNL